MATKDHDVIVNNTDDATGDKPDVTDKYNNADIEFINTHKQYIINNIMDYANQYINDIRSSNDKKLTIDAQAKDQIMYIFEQLISIISNAGDDSPNSVGKWIEDSYKPISYEYKL